MKEAFLWLAYLFDETKKQEKQSNPLFEEEDIVFDIVAFVFIFCLFILLMLAGFYL